MSSTKPESTFGAQRSGAEFFVLALLRIAVGWHFAYEGLTKLLSGTWTSAGYLQSAQWIGADWFHWIAAHPTALKIVDQLNIWGLLLIGAALMLGLLTRLSAVFGMLLLALYYVAQPSLFGQQPSPAEGTYLLVNKNVVELLALFVLAVLPAGRWGLDGLWCRSRSARRTGAGPVPVSLEPDGPTSVTPLARRRVLASLLGVPFVGGFVLAVLKQRGYQSQEEKQLAVKIDGLSGATMKPFDVKTLDDLKGQVPKGKIKDVELSRVFLGGNLMNGFAHARDLIYVSKLIRAYHYPERIFETFRMAEACGMNTILTNPMLAPMIVEYWNRGIGKIQFISQCKGKTQEDLLDCVQYSIDNGCCAAYVQGAAADQYVFDGSFDYIENALAIMRQAGIPAGIGGHHIETIQACVDRGFKPDFWMKTFHHHHYWSANVENQHDNIWCERPDEVIRYMESLPQPWIAFKVLAAGSIKPKDGFRFAFQNGADFLCIGMYDFQVVENANTAVGVLDGQLERKRPWCA